MLARLKIATRINLIPPLVALAVLASLAITLWSLRSQMIEDRQAQLKNLLNLALSVARADMKAAGGAPAGAGRNAFLSVLASARFGDEREKNYIFAYDYDGTTLSHGDPKKIGENRLDAVYANGVKMVQKFIEIAKSPAGSGFAQYPIEKGANGLVTPKLTFVQNVPEIGGVAGVGVYIDDIDAAFLSRLVTEGILVSLLLIVVTAWTYLVGRSISKPLSELTRTMARLARDLNIHSANSGETSELGSITKTIEVLRKNAVERNTLLEKMSEAREADGKRRHYFQSHVRDFQKIVTAVLSALNEQVNQLRQSAETLSHAAETATSEAANAANVSAGAADNSHAVAAATEELSGRSKAPTERANTARGPESCQDIEDITRIMANSRDPKQLLDVWTGWHAISPPMRQDFARYVELANKGAKELGFQDNGAMWRSKYDMPPDDFAKEFDRLWDQVRPLYLSLHAYVRTKLREKYGDAVPASGPIPAHLLGNMWAQNWDNIYPLVAPANADPGYDLTAILKKRNTD